MCSLLSSAFHPQYNVHKHVFCSDFNVLHDSCTSDANRCNITYLCVLFFQVFLSVFSPTHTPNSTNSWQTWCKHTVISRKVCAFYSMLNYGVFVDQLQPFNMLQELWVCVAANVSNFICMLQQSWSQLKDFREYRDDIFLSAACCRHPEPLLYWHFL